MNDNKASLTLFATIMGVLLTTSLPAQQAKEIPMAGVRILKLREHAFPDPNKVRGVVIYYSELHYAPWDDTPSIEPNVAEPSLVVGERKEIERLMGRKIRVPLAVCDEEAVRTIAQLYAHGLAQLPSSFLFLTQERIAFVTDEAAYVRGFSADNGEVREKYLISGAIWREFRKLGALNETEPDTNAPSYIPPVLASGNHALAGMATRGVRILTLGPYDMPSEEVRGILIYGESNIGAEHGLEDRNLCLAIGDRRQLERLTKGEVTPRLMVSDADAIPRICRLYSEMLSPFAAEAAKSPKPPYRSMYGTAWTIVFLTDNGAYVRGFGVEPDRRRIYDEWMKSLTPDLYQEFVKIGYLKEAPARKRSN